MSGRLSRGLACLGFTVAVFLTVASCATASLPKGFLTLTGSPDVEPPDPESLYPEEASGDGFPGGPFPAPPPGIITHFRVFAPPVPDPEPGPAHGSDGWRPPAAPPDYSSPSGVPDGSLPTPVAPAASVAPSGREEACLVPLPSSPSSLQRWAGCGGHADGSTKSASATGGGSEAGAVHAVADPLPAGVSAFEGLTARGVSSGPPTGVVTVDLRESRSPVPHPVAGGGWEEEMTVLGEAGAARVHVGGVVVPFSALPRLWVAVGLSLSAIPLWRAYRRLQRVEVFSNPTRSAVYEGVAAAPGQTAGGLALALGVDRRTVLHHLDVLKGFGFVEARRMGGWVRYYRNGDAHPDDEKQAHAVLRTERARRVLACLLKHPGVSLNDVSARTGIPRGTVRWHVDRFKRFGVLDASGRVAPAAVDAALARRT